MKKVNKKKKNAEQNNAVNEWMKFALTTTIALGMALAYAKGYNDAKNKKKNKVEAFKK